MTLDIRLPEKNSILLFVLAFLFIITRLPPAVLMPFMQDEAIYAIMIDEQAANPTLIPTFLGYPVSWKPPLFFWTYSVLSQTPLPLELSYRLPSIVFGLATIMILFHLLRNLGISRNITFFSLIVFIFSYPTLYAHVALLTDSMLFFLISSSLYLYSEKRLGDWRFLAAGALAFLAFWVKLVIAFIIPVLAVAYFLTMERKTLQNRSFILSLLAVPAAFVLHFMVYYNAGLAEELYISVIRGHLLSQKKMLGPLETILESLYVLFEGAGIWLALSIFGFWKYWRDNLVMTAWYLLSIFPLLGGGFMPWYFLPVFPAIAFFAVKLLLIWKGRERADALFWAFLISAILLTSGLTTLIYHELHGRFIPQKEAGLFLVDKENVAVVGSYDPAILTYKMLNEEEPKDIGWLLGPQNISKEQVTEFANDYYSDKYEVSEGSFSPIFINSEIYRKDTNITDFDYVVTVWRGRIDVDGDLVFNHSEINIYKVD